MSLSEKLGGALKGWLSPAKITGYFEDRYRFSAGAVKEWAGQNVLRRPLPAGWGWVHYLGPTIVFLFVVQIITGLALCFYYKPTPDEAHLSIKYIMNQVPYGWLIRSIHSWASYLLVLALLAHLGRAFAARAYAYPRELTWIVGVLGCACVLALGFTGDLLPWDQNSYWTTTVMTSEVKDLPLGGRYAQLFLRGGEEVGSGTLTRFFIYHVLLFPGSLFLLILLHIAMVWRQGITETSYPSLSPAGRGTPTIFPHFVLDAGIILYLLFSFLLGLTVFLPSGLPDLANPAQAPKSLKPEWYLISFYQFYKILPHRILLLPRVAVFLGLCILGAVGLFFLPFYDTGSRRTRVALWGGLGAASLYIGLTVWGLLS